ncbi:L7Ae/L30e/S12e/Gadd45 family ribosomal protein [Acidaminococcus provencensis]|uniref:L7Ae/L30e/S12e/Gadd45 family ribosomal protein n=1 Tax=Acidaminococcus provencensis TaxID=2058289 RepID=UPI001F3A28DF|nr:ribosomal L7Ae/L30e/S12e/Gadd45 family protein [Acidaminococcus provencensis]
MKLFLADVKNGSPVVVGVKQSQKAIARGQAVGALIALDADEHVTGPIKALCEAAGVRLETVSTMQELGKACGIHVGASVAAVLKTR